MQDLIQIIESTWENRDLLKEQQNKEAVREVIALLDSGKIRVAERITQGEWKVNDWIKKAILLYFPISENKKIMAGDLEFFDKIPTKKNYEEAGVRAVPHAIARYIAGGVGIGGVLEPPQAAPNIIEDNCFIGSRCIIVEGTIIEEEAVLGANVVITASTHIIDVTQSEPVQYKARIPARSVVIPGSYTKQYPAGEYQVPCALIIGQRKPSTDKKVSLNDALRDFGVSV